MLTPRLVNEALNMSFHGRVDGQLFVFSWSSDSFHTGSIV